MKFNQSNPVSGYLRSGDPSSFFLLFPFPTFFPRFAGKKNPDGRLVSGERVLSNKGWEFSFKFGRNERFGSTGHNGRYKEVPRERARTYY